MPNNRPELLKYEFKQQATEPGKLELYIYSVVAPDGFDWIEWKKKVSETSQDYFRKQLDAHKGVQEIVLYINSIGGSVIEGYGIYAQLCRHPAKKTVYVDGYAMSIAGIIAMCGDEIIMRINSVFGVHNMLNECYGNAAEHRKCADDLDQMMIGNRQLLLKRSGGKITEEKLTELMDADTILTAQQCLEYGFCDRIEEEPVTSDEQMAQMMQRMNLGLAAQMEQYRILTQAHRSILAMQQSAVAQPEPPAPDPEPTPPEPEPAPQQKSPDEPSLARFFNTIATKERK